jgi:hypothetical protein
MKSVVRTASNASFHENLQSRETRQSPGVITAVASQAECTQKSSEEWLSSANRRTNAGAKKRKSRQQDELSHVKDCYVALGVPAKSKYVRTATVLPIS